MVDFSARSFVRRMAGAIPGIGPVAATLIDPREQLEDLKAQAAVVGVVTGNQALASTLQMGTGVLEDAVARKEAGQSGPGAVLDAVKNNASAKAIVAETVSRKLPPGIQAAAKGMMMDTAYTDKSAAEVHMHDGDGKGDVIVDPKILAAAKASINSGGQTQKGAINKALSATGEALDMAGQGVDLLPIGGLDDAGAALLRLAGGLVKAGGELADGNGKAAGKEALAGVGNGAVALVPLLEYGDVASKLTTGQSLSQHAANTVVSVDRKDGQPDMPPPPTRDFAHLATKQTATKSGRS